MSASTLPPSLQALVTARAQAMVKQVEELAIEEARLILEGRSQLHSDNPKEKEEGEETQKEYNLRVHDPARRPGRPHVSPMKLSESYFLCYACNKWVHNGYETPHECKGGQRVRIGEKGRGAAPKSTETKKRKPYDDSIEEIEEIEQFEDSEEDSGKKEKTEGKKKKKKYMKHRGWICPKCPDFVEAKRSWHTCTDGSKIRVRKGTREELEKKSTKEVVPVSPSSSVGSDSSDTDKEERKEEKTSVAIISLTVPDSPDNSTLLQHCPHCSLMYDSEDISSHLSVCSKNPANVRSTPPVPAFSLVSPSRIPILPLTSVSHSSSSSSSSSAFKPPKAGPSA